MREKGVTIGARGTSSISSLISGMTLRERRALHESVKRRILREEANTEAEREKSVRETYKESQDIQLDSGGKFKYFTYKQIDGWLWQVIRGEDDVVTILLLVDPRSKRLSFPEGSNPPQWLSNGQKYNVDKYGGVTYASLASTLSAESPKIKEIIDNDYNEIAVGRSDAGATSTSAPAAAPTASTAPPAAEEKTPSDKSPVGSTLMKGSTKVFEKTAAGWKATLRLTLSQILSIVKPEYQAEVKQDLMNLPERDELPITKGYLKNPNMVFTGGGLTFQRDGEVFADPVAIPGEKIKEIQGNLGLDYKEGATDASSNIGAVGQRWAVGNVIFSRVSVEEMTITVKDDGSGTYSDFNSIFGKGANVPGLIQQAAKKNKGRVDLIKIPLRFSDENSLMKRFNVKVFDVFGGENILDAGKIIFKKQGDDFVCTLTGKKRIEAAVEILGEMSGAGRASSLGGEIQNDTKDAPSRAEAAGRASAVEPSSDEPSRGSEKSVEKKLGIKRKLESLQPGTRLYSPLGGGENYYFAARLLDVAGSNRTFIGISETPESILLSQLNPERRDQAEKIIAGRESGSLFTSIDDYVKGTDLMGSGPRSTLAFDYDKSRRVFKDVTQYTTDDIIKFIRILKRKGIKTMIEARNR